MKNVAVVVEEEPTAEELKSLGLDPEQDDLFGLYQGVPLPERGPDAPVLPDRIAIYRLPILWACETREEAVAEIRTTVIPRNSSHLLRPGRGRAATPLSPAAHLTCSYPDRKIARTL